VQYRGQVTRFKTSFALSLSGVIALFAIFILFRYNAALISALSAAGAGPDTGGTPGGWAPRRLTRAPSCSDSQLKS
jgi:hypothetical protein